MQTASRISRAIQCDVSSGLFKLDFVFVFISFFGRIYASSAPLTVECFLSFWISPCFFSFFLCAPPLLCLGWFSSPWCNSFSYVYVHYHRCLWVFACLHYLFLHDLTLKKRAKERKTKKNTKIKQETKTPPAPSLFFFLSSFFLLALSCLC